MASIVAENDGEKVESPLDAPEKNLCEIGPVWNCQVLGVIFPFHSAAMTSSVQPPAPCYEPDTRFSIETVTSDNRWVVKVEGEAALDACMKSLEASIAEEPWICVDFEGVHLGRSGSLTLVQICSLRPESPVFVIDVLVLGRIAIQRIQPLLENPDICKVVFDARMDVDTLTIIAMRVTSSICKYWT